MNHHMHGGVNEERKVHAVTIEENHIMHLFFAVMDCLLLYGSNDYSLYTVSIRQKFNISTQKLSHMHKYIIICISIQ